MNGLHGNNLSYTTNHYNNISAILHGTLLCVCISLLRQTIKHGNLEMTFVWNKTILATVEHN